VIQEQQVSSPPLRLLGTQLLVRLVEVADRTAGGILLPEVCRTNEQEAEVVACGPGIEVAAYPGMRSIVYAEPGDRVLFAAHDFVPVNRGARLGSVHDEDLLAILTLDRDGRDQVLPMGEFCLVEPDAWETHTASGLAIPEGFRHRPQSGILRAVGPGELRLTADLAGLRRRISQVLGVTDEQALIGTRVWWRAGCEVLEAGREHVAHTLVRASDLVAWWEPEE